MYENNYPNNYNTNNSNSGTQTTGNAANNTYQYQTGSSFNSAAPAPKPPQKQKKSNGIGQKIAIGICCGLLFGIFAGLGFQAVDTASTILRESTGIGKSSSSDADTQSNMKESGLEEAADTSQADAGATAATDTEEATEASSGAVAKAKMEENVQTTVTDVTQVVKDVMPAVVSINNKYVETMSFFGQAYSNEAISTGSGIIVGQNDTELLLVSNYHVVASADELTVQFVNGTQVQAQIKGTDEDKDLAIIAVQLSEIDQDTLDSIVVAQLGDSDALTVGEPVIAIGNALGYGQSVTTGVVSALNRPIAANTTQTDVQQTADTEINTFIQTDAAINPGNSGGALLNTHGEVIGINSNKIGGNIVEGMGYAIPITDAKPIIEELMSKQTRLKVDEESKGYLGITGVDIAAEYSEVYGIPQGVYISSVFEGSAAQDAGLVKGDIITAVNDEKVTSMNELKEELAYYTSGTSITLTIMQGSPEGYQPKDINLTLGVQSSN